jgi:hypothetical protein
VGVHLVLVDSSDYKQLICDAYRGITTTACASDAASVVFQDSKLVILYTVEVHEDDRQTASAIALSVESLLQTEMRSLATAERQALVGPCVFFETVDLTRTTNERIIVNNDGAKTDSTSTTSGGTSTLVPVIGM